MTIREILARLICPDMGRRLDRLESRHEAIIDEIAECRTALKDLDDVYHVLTRLMKMELSMSHPIGNVVYPLPVLGKEWAYYPTDTGEFKNWLREHSERKAV